MQDSFTLSLRRPCSDAVITQTNNLGEFIYYIGSGNSAVIRPTYTTNPVGCIPFFYLHFWNKVELIWEEWTAVKFPFAQWTSATG